MKEAKIRPTGTWMHLLSTDSIDVAMVCSHMYVWVGVCGCVCVCV